MPRQVAQWGLQRFAAGMVTQGRRHCCSPASQRAWVECYRTDAQGSLWSSSQIALGSFDSKAADQEGGDQRQHRTPSEKGKTLNRTPDDFTQVIVLPT